SLSYVDTLYQVHFSFADLLLKMGRRAEARRELLLSLECNPNHFNSAAMLSKLYYQAADYDSALVMYEIMHRLKADDTTLLPGIARLRSYLGRDGEALQAYLALLDAGTLSPEDLERAMKIAVGLDRPGAVERIAAFAAENPGDHAQALRLASRYSIGKGDAGTARRHLEMLTDPGMSDPEILESLAGLAEKKGDGESLVFALESLHRISPEDVDVITSLAEHLLNAGDGDGALAWVGKGLALEPENGKLRILKGNYYRDRGETDMALAEYEIALRDEAWQSSARQFIWQIRPPQTEEEKAEQKFFERGQKKRNRNRR
ncbi:MAG: tetratricopeptide repeat protein, partial [Candidatus Latescibacteria bacterium]|nr:tetratricopeptide repeat protein [Candidatus Latescibacterota bacterium]